MPPPRSMSRKKKRQRSRRATWADGGDESCPNSDSSERPFDSDPDSSGSEVKLKSPASFDPGEPLPFIENYASEDESEDVDYTLTDGLPPPSWRRPVQEENPSTLNSVSNENLYTINVVCLYG